MKITQEQYAQLEKISMQCMAKVCSDPEVASLMTKASPTTVGGTIDPKDWKFEHPLIKRLGRTLMKRQYEEMFKAGVSTALGFNFYDLRGPAYFIFPLLTPFVQNTPKAGKVNAGVGTTAHWKATRNPNSTYTYAGLGEGQRNAIATPNEIDYFATYKELGMEGGNTFTSQFAGEGYTDNLADEHFRNLARLRLQEEMFILNGNSGPSTLNSLPTGNLGYALGQAPNVTSTLATGTSALVTGSNIVVAVVAITPFGMNPGGQAGYAAPPSVAGGLTPNYTRTNADNSQTNVSCGLSAISNVAAIVTTNAAAQLVNVSVPAVKGAVGYAWFWGVNVAAAVGNVKLGAITSAPNYQISNVPAGTQLGNAAGLSTDNSYQSTDFDGLLTYSFNQGLWTDMNGGSFTSAGNGLVKEIEADLAYLWINFQAQPDAIWCSADVRLSLEQAIIYSQSGTNSFVFTTTQAGQAAGMTGGFVISGYKSKYSITPEGGVVIPIRIHPMLPTGTLFYDINTIPAAYSSSRLPAVRELMLQRDYYAVEWPVVTRQWTFGTYIHEVLAHYIPWITAIRTGIGPFVAPCWIAAAVFDESFEDGPRVGLVRRWLVNDWEKSGPLAKLVMGLYRKYGERVAEHVKTSPILKRVFRGLFDRVLAKAEAKYGKL